MAMTPRLYEPPTVKLLLSSEKHLATPCALEAVHGSLHPPEAKQRVCSPNTIDPFLSRHFDL